VPEPVVPEPVVPEPVVPVVPDVVPLVLVSRLERSYACSSCVKCRRSSLTTDAVTVAPEVIEPDCEPIVPDPVVPEPVVPLPVVPDPVVPDPVVVVEPLCDSYTPAVRDNSSSTRFAWSR